MIRLPLFITAKNKVNAGIVLFLIALFLYSSTNHFPASPPKLLPMTAFDHWIPFLPWTVLIYVSEYIFFVVVYLTCRDHTNLNKYFYAFLFTQAFSCLIFYFYPTTYPRENFPIPADTSDFLKFVWGFLRTTDAPTNCLPSLHVSTVYLSAFIFRDEQREKYPYFLAWGTFIALSTLPTKQHYLIDVVAGYLLAVIVYVVFKRWIQYYPLGEPKAVSRA